MHSYSKLSNKIPLPAGRGKDNPIALLKVGQSIFSDRPSAKTSACTYAIGRAYNKKIHCA